MPRKKLFLKALSSIWKEKNSSGEKKKKTSRNAKLKRFNLYDNSMPLQRFITDLTFLPLHIIQWEFYNFVFYRNLIEK